MKKSKNYFFQIMNFFQCIEFYQKPKNDVSYKVK